MRTVIVALAVCLALAGCGADRPLSGLRVMVPNNPGSGYDVTARSAALVVEDAGLARSVEVFNLPGAGGTIGLQRLVNERGNGALLMQMGLGVVGAVHTARSPVSFADTTPIARLTEDAETVVVPADSPYRSLAELTTAWRADPARVPVAGGSSPGGPDHLAAHLLAQAVGLDPGRVDYRGFDGGGDLLAAVLGHRVAFGVSSSTEFRDQIDAGQLRVLAVTSAARVRGVDAPTLREAGVDLQFASWRGLVAPPGTRRGRPARADRAGRRDARHAGVGAGAGADGRHRRVPDRRRVRRVPARRGRAGRGRAAPARPVAR